MGNILLLGCPLEVALSRIPFMLKLLGCGLFSNTIQHVYETLPSYFIIAFIKVAHRQNFSMIKVKMELFTKFSTNMLLMVMAGTKAFNVVKEGLVELLDKYYMTFHKPTFKFLSSLEICDIGSEQG